MFKAFIFYRLVLAHLLGDFPLQLDVVYKLKVQKKQGLWLHIGIHVFLMILLLFPFLHSYRVRVLIYFVTLCHFITDRSKLELGKRLPVMSENGKVATGIFLLDQVIHFGILAVSLLFLDSESFSFNPESFLMYLYNSNNLMVLLSVLILAVYFSPIFAAISSQIFFNGKDFKQEFKKEGLLYRLLVTLFFLCIYSWIISISLIAIKTYFVKKEYGIKSINFYKHTINSAIPTILGLFCYFTDQAPDMWICLKGLI